MPLEGHVQDAISKLPIQLRMSLVCQTAVTQACLETIHQQIQHILSFSTCQPPSMCFPGNPWHSCLKYQNVQELDTAGMQP